MSAQWSSRAAPSEDHIDLAHGFVDFPGAFGVGFEEERVAAGEVNRVFTIGREAAAARQKMHDFRLLHRAPVGPGRAFEPARIDRLAAPNHFLPAGHPDFPRARKTGRAPVFQTLYRDALPDLLNFHSSSPSSGFDAPLD